MNAKVPIGSHPIRFTRRVQPPRDSRARSEAAVPVRPVAKGTVRSPGRPGQMTRTEPVVWVSPETFHEILQISADPLIVREERGWPLRRTQWTTQWQGYYFTTRVSRDGLRTPPGARVIFAERVEFR
jgi:hypothetical protein